MTPDDPAIACELQLTAVSYNSHLMTQLVMGVMLGGHGAHQGSWLVVIGGHLWWSWGDHGSWLEVIGVIPGGHAGHPSWFFEQIEWEIRNG